jgi:predicted transcriptional regulator
MLVVYMTRLLKGMAVLGVVGLVAIAGGPAEAAFHQTRLDEIKKLRETRMQKIEERAGERQEAREERREKFQTEVKKVRDEKQRTAALRTQERLNTLNQRRVARYEQYLDHLTLVLDKIERHTNDIEEKGASVTDVRTAIAAARTKIEAAETAVTAQKAKEYVVTIADGQSLGQALQAAVHEWRDDHQALHQGPLREAKESVHAARRELVEARETLPI